MKKIIITLLLFLNFIGFSQQNSTKIKMNIPAKRTKIAVYTTCEGSNLKLSNTQNLLFKDAVQPLETQSCIFVNPTKKFQTFLGIGGAITDASAEVFAKLPIDKQQELLNSYYSKDKGIGYSLIRTTIHSSDFSSESYTYIDEGDAALATFNITHDKKFKIPLIKKATETAGGKVTFAGRYRSFGNIMIIDHGGGWTTLVTNIEELGVAAGAIVAQGALIGRAGADRPEIMIELRRYGRTIDLLALIA